MIHRRAGRKLKRTASHRKAMLCNMASSLFQHKKISTTEAKAKELRPFAEALITRAKHALQREQQGQLPSGQVIDIHNRREVYKSIRNKGVVQELFDTIAPAVASRPGGYTRIVKLGTRRGDAGRVAIIELVDFAAARDGVIRTRRKKAAVKSTPKVVAPVAVPAAVIAPAEEVIAPSTEVTEDAVIVASAELTEESTESNDIIVADETPAEPETEE
jgi:large subunit ribosomal protein L17